MSSFNLLMTKSSGGPRSWFGDAERCNEDSDEDFVLDFWIHYFIMREADHALGMSLEVMQYNWGISLRIAGIWLRWNWWLRS